jgi:large subunit ribosomal protein L19
MKQSKLIQDIESEQLKSNLPQFSVGDTLRVHLRIAEGDKERIQMFTGTVIARRGSGLSESVALYRFSYGAGMERLFLLHSPKIVKIEVIKKGSVRKSKLYYLRGHSGKAAKVKEKLLLGKSEEVEAATEESQST